jgi:hypothetical protein
VLGACSSGDVSSSSIIVTTTTSSTTTIVETTTTTRPETTTMAPETTTTTVVGQVGDPELLAAEFRDLEPYLPQFYAGYPDDPLPVPDFSMPDPVEALQAILAYDQLVFERYPLPDLVFLYTYPDSPGEDLFRNAALRFLGMNWVEINARAPSFELSRIEVLNLDESSGVVPDDERTAAPEGSMVVNYTIVYAPVERVDRDTGDPGESFGERVFDDTAILVPTALGWQLFYLDGVQTS